LKGVFAKRLDACRGVADNPSDGVRAAQVALHKFGRCISEQDHLRSGTAHQVYSEGLCTGENVSDAILTGASHRPRDAIRNPNGNGNSIVSRTIIAVVSRLAAQRAL